MSAHSNFVRIRVPAPESQKSTSGSDASAVEPAQSSPLEGGEVSREAVWGAAGGETVELLCTSRGLLKKMAQRVYVGDIVKVTNIDWVMNQGKHFG